MEQTEVQSALTAAVEEVLETMCFAIVLSSSDDAIPEGNSSDWMTAMLRFEGKLSGEFRLSVPVKLARTVGSGFLGTEETEISDSQAAEVVCELANMFCGSALSRLEADTIFRLSHPELAPAESGTPVNRKGVGRRFELEDGTLAASFDFQRAL